MKSHVSVTYEIDDPNIAAEELAKGIHNGFAKSGNSIGLLFSYSDIELDSLVASLREQVDFDIIGCTTIASMDHKDGFHELAATLTVLTADDCQFSAAVSGPITPANVTHEIEQTYRRAADALPGEPGLVFALPPYILEVMLDEYSNTFNAIAPGVPVVGGLPSYNGTGDVNRTVFGGESYGDRLVVLAVSGNIHPVFSVQTVTSSPLERKRRVTRAKGNVIYEVGEQTFTEYLAEIGMPIDTLTAGNTTVTFVANPLLLEQTRGEGEHFAFLRTLHEIDLKEGSGTAIGEIPQDATVSICPLHRDEIAAAATEGIRALNEKMKAVENYTFGTVLAVSCIGRHLLMAPNGSVETDRLLAELAPGLSLSGFYGYGEIGPLPTGDSSLVFAHNESMVLCAF